MAQVLRFLQAEDGPTAVEYAVMLGLIIAVCLTAIGMLGQTAENAFGTTVRDLDSLGVSGGGVANP